MTSDGVLTGSLFFFSRMMATPHTSAKLTFLETIRRIHTAEGYKGYFRGLGPSLLRAFPVNASALWVYEGLMRLLDTEKVSRRGIVLIPEHSDDDTPTDEALTVGSGHHLFVHTYPDYPMLHSASDTCGIE